MNWDNLPILMILLVSVIGNNHSVSIAAAALLLIKLLGLDLWFPYIQSHGIDVGITVITMAVLIPLVQGRISIGEMLDACKSQTGLVAILIGILVAWLATKGMFFMKEVPESVTSLIVGTIIGVCFFHGLAVGPLIAGGIVSVAVSFLSLFNS